MRKYTYLFLLIGTLLLAACSGGNNDSNDTQNNAPSNDEKRDEQVIKIANDQEPAGLDPHKTPAHSSITVYSNIYEGLTTFDEDMEVIGQLAEDWEIEDDVIYTFKLVEGVKFHNDREMTAEDVKYSFERILDEETASHIKSYFTNIKDIEVVNDYEVKFELESPDATFLTNLTNASAVIVAEEVVEENEDLQQVAIGTGPFVFEEWVPDNRVILNKNEDYYVEDIPQLDRIEYYTMQEESSRLSAIRTGEIDMTKITAKTADLLEDAEDVNVLDYQSLEYSYVGFNTDKEPFDDPKVRLALSMATNRDSIKDIVWDGDAIVSGPIAPAMGDWAIDVEDEEAYSNDIEKAKQLLDEAGYPDGFETVITTASTYDDMKDTAQILQQQWKEIGVDAEIKQVEWGEYIDIWSDTKADILIGRNGSGSDPDRAMNYFFHTDGSANVWNFSDDKYDTLVEEGKVTIEESDRQEIYNQAQELLIELSPNLFLVSPEDYVAVRDNVADFKPYAHDGQNLEKVFITE